MPSQSNHPLPNNDPHKNDPHKLETIGVLVLFVVTLPIIIGIVTGAQMDPAETTRMTSVSLRAVEPIVLSAGETVYQNTCMVCHGPTAEGVVGLGKPLRNSGYIQDSDDAELFRNIAEGRMPDHPLNTSGIVMPARGAQNISDGQINDVMEYLRSIQDSSQALASIEAWIIEREETAVAFDGPGRDLFLGMCSACHGPNGEGMDGLGKPFTTSEFIQDSTDKEIITLVKMGRPIWDAANTTGVDMPSKGGNPAMTDDELNDIITYIRSISILD